ncbi:aromatic acid/H+ symport family MFS transporter [Pseudonocardia sp. NPDC049154]|uniref:MFS transporter n=1 Tax=Pseudonocardia sp. NPDC049154 TaxID=3155501 RepID=UPI0033E56AF1
MTSRPASPTAGQSLTVTELIASGPLGGRRIGYIVIGFLCVLLDGIDIGAWGFVYPHLVADWGTPAGQITTVVTAGYVTLALGALIAGPCADRFGRKPTLIVSVILFGGAMTAAAFATDITTLGVLRSIACLGLGAVFPSAIALVSEFMPLRRKAFLVTVVFCGFPLGQAVVGYLAAFIVPSFGWQVLLLIGGMAGLALVPLTLSILPESVALQMQRPNRLARAERTAETIARSMGVTRQITLTPQVRDPEESEAAGRGGVRTVLSRKVILTSIVVWYAYLANCTITYVLIGYLPLIMATMGMDASESGQVIGLLGWGGAIGSLLIGYAMSRIGNHRTLVLSLALTAVSIAVVAFGAWPLAALLVLGFVWGLLNGGANAGMNAFAASAFPTHARGTGVAWMHSAGKLGAIAAGLVGGLMIGAGWGIGAIFLSFALPVLIAAAGFALLALTQPTATEKESR